jgi:ribosomal subunit interface protein
MIENIEISGRKYEVSDEVEKYVLKRFGKVSKFMPKKLREEAALRVVIAEINEGGGNKYEVSAELRVPGWKEIVGREKIMNVFAGVDIVEKELIEQVKKKKR